MLHINGVSEHATPGGLMGHGRTLEAKEGGKFRGAQARLVGQGFEPGVTREPRQYCNEQENIQGVANATGFASVSEGLQAFGQRL